MLMEKSWKPLSTPTTLGSKYGLGGGPLVGSQSLRLGGSTFLPGRTLLPHSDAQYDVRYPTNVKWSSNTDTMPLSSNFAPPMTSRLARRKMMVNNEKPGIPISQSSVATTTATDATAPSPALPLVDEVISANAATPPVLLASAPLSNSKVKGSYFVGAAPTSPNQIPEGMVLVDTRDGKIIQPR